MTLTVTTTDVSPITEAPRHRRATSAAGASVTISVVGSPSGEKHQERIKSMPEPWKVDYYLHGSSKLAYPFLRLEALYFQFLCMIAWGRTDMKTLWKNMGDREAFRDISKNAKDSLDNTNIMSGLLLATSAVFLSATTPRPDMLAFSSTVSYVFMMFSFGVAMGAMLTGCVVQLVIARWTPRFIVSLTPTRVRLHCCLILLGFPLFAVAISCNACAVGLLVASFQSPYAYILAGAVFLVALPWSLFMIFVWLSLAPAIDRFRRSVFTHHPTDQERLQQQEPTSDGSSDVKEKAAAS
ncbi:hypothetical protein BDN72DRAFT_844800 [Pluteus cervinus]|uniref:Uncharacterized protein n=1 Tax=Pluteus cervinus TaxID=181527 RepID=A0ACD3AL12_9AGAR|nr:hypothetical protein BDN72DRAFT_844800 [Pluteus cervinus]